MCLVDDVQSETEGLIELCTCDFTESADRRGVEISNRHADEVVAVDDTDLRKTLGDTDFHLGTNAAYGPRDGGAGD